MRPVELDYETNLLRVSFKVRAYNLLLGIIAAGLMKYALGVDIPGEFFWIFYLWLLTSLGYMKLFGRKRFMSVQWLDAAHFSYYFLSVPYATMQVHYLGGAEWIAFFMYLFDMVYANVLMRRSRGSFITASAALSYFSLIFLEYKGVIPHRGIFEPVMARYDDPVYCLATGVIAVGAVFLILASSTGFFCRIKEERERKLDESRSMFEEKSEQLERLTRALRKKVAENKYLKSATMGYLAKKELELKKGKEDMAEQIEKLRKTQKAMVFMIEDLNGMSAQLKEARDSLEDKVRKRTDELLSINQRLQRSERLAFLGKIAGSLTHELRNPLAVLKNTAFFLDKSLKKTRSEKTAKHIEVISREITIIDGIIDDIMGFARIKQPELAQADLKSVVENAINTIKKPELVKVRREFQDLPEVRIDTDQLMYALVNIGNSSIMAMNGKGVLTFRITRSGKEACIEVEDNGPGIPPGDREFMFEPLYSNKPGGTGLGLPTAKMMIENQGGRIEYGSALNKGSVFRVFLPMIEQDKKRTDG